MERKKHICFWCGKKTTKKTRIIETYTLGIFGRIIPTQYSHVWCWCASRKVNYRDFREGLIGQTSKL